MICNVLDKDNYIIKIFNNYNDIDIYDHDNIENFVKKIFNNHLKKYNLTGKILFNVYIDKLYGMIIEIKKLSDLIIDKLIDIKIKFNLNVSFLYEVDYFYLVENNINNQNIYYYKDKFYLEIINDINEKDYINLINNSIIVYGDEINNIFSNGFKFKKMLEN